MLNIDAYLDTSIIDIEIDRKIQLKIDKYNGHLDRYIEMKININKARDIRPQRHALANHQLGLIFSSDNPFFVVILVA